MPAPRTAYGRTKLAGEQAVLSQLAGGRLRGADGLAVRRARAELRPHDDPAGGPAPDGRRRRRPARPAHLDRDVARQILALAAPAAAPGIYHATSCGQTTWFGLARAVFGLLGADPDRVRPIPSSALPRPAPRPAYSVLGPRRLGRAGLPPIGDWRDALERAFPDVAAPAAAADLQLMSPSLAQVVR